MRSRLAIVFSPGLLKAPVEGLSEIRADKVVLVHDRVPDIKQMGLWFSFNFGPMSWAPTNRWVRAKLDDLGFQVPVEAEDWRSAGLALPAPVDPKPAGRRLVMGRVSAIGAAQWPKTAAELEATYPTDVSIDFRVLGSPPPDLLKASKAASNWSILKFSDVAVERFIGMLDVFIYYPGARTPELPEAAISTAMASGKIVVLPPHLRPHFGPGALYAEPKEALAAIRALFDDEVALAEARKAAIENCRFQFSATDHMTKIKALAGDPLPSPPRRKSKPAARKRALLVPSNGIGLGHVTRLLAIARRLDEEIEPVFATLGQAVSIIDSFGYHADYLPSQSDIGANLADWDAWLRYELGALVERHAPDIVIYDGNNPTPGLVNAALTNGHCQLAWVRRAMCPPTPSPFLENARFFDCIIEPGEYAGERDTGPTSFRRHEATLVSPIRLLDEGELLPKDAARKELGLAPDKPAVLLHLGAGANRDILDLIDRVVRDLGRFPALQIVIAEWKNGAVQLPHWPNTKVLRGFPISQYFNAFDFSVAAAGYNTFHEVLGFGLPTIFLANRNPSMDDQGARAEYAQDESVGFDLPVEELHHLPALCEALLNEKANAFIRQKCHGFDKTNGAHEAAAAIKRLVGA
ncbi:hypothetical protein E2K80_14650 [Rhodophyticola sp. CCM32]|nr:hypothetical protein E2K80_14650 [Rhodophyticola sp. CCM32]